MSNDLSFLTPVQSDHGKAQWVQGKLTDVGIARSVAAAAMALALTGCSLGGLGGPYPGVPELQSSPRYDIRGRPEWVPPSSGGVKKAVAPPQVTYRIDDSRYFELVHDTHQACANAGVFYVDKAKGIRSFVVTLDPAVTGASNFIIDAANDQYLIGPVTRGNTDCSSGGGSCKGASMPYSTDAGRTWKQAPADPYSARGVSGSVAYSAGVRNLTRSLDLSKADVARGEWTYLPNFTFSPRKAPLDTKFHCTENGKE
jgi:hypothetical protein